MLLQLLDKYNNEAVINTDYITCIQQIGSGDYAEFCIHFTGGNQLFITPFYRHLLIQYLNIKVVEDKRPEDTPCSTQKKSLVD